MTISYGSPGSLTADLVGPYSGGTGGSGDVTIVGSVAKFVNITLPSSSWKGAISPYSQTVNVSGVSVNSMVDLAADKNTLEILMSNGTAIYMDNNGGTVTAYAIGQKPTASLTLQAIITEGVVTS